MRKAAPPMSMAESINAIYGRLDVTDTRGLVVDITTMVDLYSIAQIAPNTNKTDLATARENIIYAVQQYEMSSEGNIEPILSKAKISLNEYEEVNSYK